MTRKLGRFTFRGSKARPGSLDEAQARSLLLHSKATFAKDAPVTSTTAQTRFGSGKSIQRVEDAALLTGKGLFADDAKLADQAVLHFLRSPHAHARIAAIDVAAAVA